MKKIAFLFPGQGSQTAGMGKDFYEQSPEARAVFDEGSELLGIDLKALCFGKNELLDRTDYTQIALTVTSIAMTRTLEGMGIVPELTAGLSLGEYAAIWAAGGMDLKDTLETVWLRGNLMHRSMEEGTGGMAAVLGLSGEQVKRMTDEISGVSVANYNCPGQVVITGEKTALEQAVSVLKAGGARRVMPLKVSGPFHSPFMRAAGEQLGERLDAIVWKPLKIPYAANVNAELIMDSSRIAPLLKEQVSAPVLWEQSVRRMLQEEVDLFVEVGPGKTLAGFLSRIDRNAKIVSVSNMEKLKELTEQIAE